MTPRQWACEHRMVAGLILGLAAALLLEGFLLSRLGPARRLAERHEPRLREMEPLAARAVELRRRRNSGAPMFLASDTRFNAEAVDRVAREQKMAERITLPSVKEEKRSDQTIEMVVSLSVKGVAPSELASFLRAVEALDPAVRTRDLNVTFSRDRPNLLDAKVQISGYEPPTATN